ncbi:MAG: hypothetical protein H0W01_03230 [Pseudonocardiales bacterium]|nr:hypothetical protein [Pseudonocardiales bacterium]
MADTVTAVRRRARTVTRVSDVPSRVRMLRMVIDSILGRVTPQPVAEAAVPVRVRELGDRRVWLRPRSHDREAFEYLEEGHHLPPAEMSAAPQHIAIFGANIVC